ncbi:unnamed protein product (macronuclear) [Paramecium tetraurelia]|uniref:Uncharacterized protein n=1 Tax=Paramecium tetraurelia TaxID=5888 RepID=A0EFF3_PARTE|nr:uncharacterized protein GSPATT00026367001 [Paramecium tetraurelia]CAK94044.1 unnamed protein product [Paramecium tetraurelia]|eukprot:XP_001461417.1 hypothetical protein (macronuclear) [Paramecium tetraurelia strain d4-2]
MRSRGLDKKQLKLWYHQAQKYVNNWNYKIEKQVYDFISQNRLLENKNELTAFQKEIIKLSIQVGHKQLQKYLKLYFFQTPHNSCSSFATNNDYENFKISLKNKNVKRNFQDFAKKQIFDGSLSLNYIDSEDDDQPEYVQSNLNKSFDLSNHISLTNIPTQNTKNKPQKPQFQKQISSKFSKQTYSIIPENMFESVESQRDIVCQFKRVVNRPMQNLNEKKIIKAPIVQIYGLIDHLSKNLPLLKQTEIGDQMKRKKDHLNPSLEEFVDYISQTFNILDKLFYNNNNVLNISSSPQKQQFHSSDKQASKTKLTQIFSSSLKESLKDKHYEEKQIEFKDYYTIFGLALNDQDEQQTFNQFLKQESIFLFNCSIIAKRLKQYKLAQKLLQKINDRVISIQVSYSLLNFCKDEPTQLILLIQNILMDFLVCGISKIVSIPLWIEIFLIRLIKLKGCNYVLGLLSALEDQDTFQLIKKIVLQTENLL